MARPEPPPDRPVDGEEATDVGYRDFLFLYGWTFALLLAIVLPWINLPAGEPVVERPDHVLVEISWPPGDVDVDLWVKGPMDRAVGYSNKGAMVFNLLRDDLGTPDPEVNWEVQISRGLQGGDYIVNIHLFRGAAPVDVKAEVTIWKNGRPTRLLAGKKTLTSWGEELTLWSFGLFDDGTLIPGSVSDRFIPLRGAGS